MKIKNNKYLAKLAMLIRLYGGSTAISEVKDE